MIRQVLAHYPYALIAIFGMLIFLGTFLGVVVWVNRRNSKEIYREIERLPFLN